MLLFAIEWVLDGKAHILRNVRCDDANTTSNESILASNYIDKSSLWISMDGIKTASNDAIPHSNGVKSHCNDAKSVLFESVPPSN